MREPDHGRSRCRSAPIAAISHHAYAGPVLPPRWESGYAARLVPPGVMQPRGQVPPPVLLSAGGTEPGHGRRLRLTVAKPTLAAERRGASGPATVPAVIVSGAGTRLASVRAALTLALHASRSASPASELQAIEELLAGGGEAADKVKRIAEETGMPVQTVRRRLRLRALSPALRKAFEAGELAATVAEAAAKLTDA